MLLARVNIPLIMDLSKDYIRSPINIALALISNTENLL